MLFPKITLVNNNGIDGTGVHCRSVRDELESMNVTEIKQLPSQPILAPAFINKVFDYLAIKNRRTYIAVILQNVCSFLKFK